MPWRCSRCRRTLPLAQARLDERRQVIDLPNTVFDVIEHHILTVTCNYDRAQVSHYSGHITQLIQYAPKVRTSGVHATQGRML